MSNCDFVASGSLGRSLIDLVASRLALRAPAPSAASALTRPNQSARRLPSGRRGVPTVKEVVGPNNVVTNHRVERSDDLAHDRNDRNLRQLAGCFEAMVERPQHRIPIARAHRRHVKHVTNGRTTAPDATPSFELATLVPKQLFGYGRSDRSSKLIHGLRAKTAAGFRSRRGRCREPTPVTPHYAPFASYKTAGFRRRAR
jgi:hypothetical protein